MINYQSKLNSLIALITVTLLLSSSINAAESPYPLIEKQMFNTKLDSVFRNDKITNQREPISKNSPKFVYAELLYQRITGTDKFSVNGKTISETVKKSIAQVKYRDEALEIMGTESWELSTTVVREISYGFEIFFYFKKKIE